jgi:hypothetical protein
MISASDLANPGIQLSSLVGDIDESISTNPLFVRNNGRDILSQLSKNISSTGTTATSTGTMTIPSQSISIIEPLE